MFMHLYTARSTPEVLDYFRQKDFGGHALKLTKQSRIGNWGGDWEYGVFSIEELAEESHDTLHEEGHDLPKTLKTLLWITTQPLYPGQDAVYDMTVDALRKWDGDLALLNNGDSVLVQRVDGKINLRVDYMNDEILAKFKEFDYEPLVPLQRSQIV